MPRLIAVSLLAVCAFVSPLLLGCGRPTSGGDSKGDDAAVAPEKVLRRMVDYLVDLPAFSCRIETVMDIKASGMDNRMVTKMNVGVERPNRIALRVEEGVMGMTVVSDGEQLYQYLPMMNQYTVEESPDDFSGFSNTEGTADAMMGLSGVVIPTNADEFYNALMQNVTSSEYLGIEQVGDKPCHHLRFEQPRFSWDIWIEEGDRPLPHRVAPDLSKQFAEAGGAMQDAKIEYRISFSDWNVSPQFAKADFAFTPPAGAEAVDSLFDGFGGGVAEEGPHPLLGQPAPTFQTVNHEGDAVDLGNDLGRNVILLDFWATWCGPCIEAMPQIDAVAEKFADRGMVFYAVNAGEDADTVKEFFKSANLEVPVAMDPDGSISSSYKVEGIPQTVLIGKDGRVQVVHVGFSHNLGAVLTQNIEDLLEGKDLAGEASAKAEEARKKRAAKRKSDVKTTGVTPAWSLAGQWSGVAARPTEDNVYAISADRGIVRVDVTGEIQQEIAVKDRGTLRLGNLVGDATPEFLVFQAWQSALQAYDAEGGALWEYPAGDGIDDVWAADINGDAVDEVIVGYNGGTGLHVLDNQGAPLWKFTEIGNVWHVAAGDFNQDDKMEVVTTSAQGAVHVFDAEGQKLKDIGVSIYGNMVRMAALDDSSLAIVAGSGSDGETLVGVNFAGEEQFALELPTSGVDHVDELSIAASVPWAAVAMRGGLVNVVDLDSAQVIARVADQGAAPQVAWLVRRGQWPLLIVATGQQLNAFEVTPTDSNADHSAVEADEPPTDGVAFSHVEDVVVEETPADTKSTESETADE